MTQALRACLQLVAEDPFRPLVRSAHLQTAVGSQLKGGSHATGEEAIVAVGDGSRVATLRAGSEPQRLVLVHGLGGDLTSPYMRSMARLARNQGFAVTLIEHYNRGLEENPRVFDAGAGDVVRAVVADELARDAETTVVIAGVSLGANVVLSAIADWAEQPPDRVRGAVVLSPLVDLAATWPRLERRENVPYVRHFLRALRTRIRGQEQHLAATIDLEKAYRARTVRDFDRAVVVPNGFRTVWHYYDVASAARRLDRARVPTVLIHARDDPLIPWAPLGADPFNANPWLEPVIVEHGGHAGFIDRNRRRWGDHTVVGCARLLFAGGRA